jgi:hypothetical protein
MTDANALSNMLIAMSDAIDWVLMVNIAAGLILWFVISAARTWLTKYTRWKSIYRHGLGYRSMVVWEGNDYMMMDRSLKYGNVTLKGNGLEHWIPFKLWIESVKTVRNNGEAKKK